MIVVILGLVVVVAVTISGLHGRTSVTSVSRGRSTMSHGTSVGGAAGTTAPTTAVISGAQLTTMFVTTTTPITATTSTTTTLPSGPSFSLFPSRVFVDRSIGSVTISVFSQWPQAVGFYVTQTPPGMTASPDHGTSSVGVPATITLAITDQASVQSGTLEVVGSNGTRVAVQVVLGGGGPMIGNVRSVPRRPVCGMQIQLVANVTGTAVASVEVVLASDVSTFIPMAANSDGSWSTMLPTATSGSAIAGQVIATDAQGRVGLSSFSIPYSGRGTCGP